MPVCKEDLVKLFETTRELIAKETALAVDSLALIGELDRLNAAVTLGIPRREVPERLGLTPDAYYKRVLAARLVRHYPEFMVMLQRGETHIAHLAMIWPHITPENRDVIARETSGRSKRELEAFLSRVSADGSLADREETVELRLNLTKSQLALLERAKEVLATSGRVPMESEVMVKALDDLLEKRDPVRRARRIQAKAEARKKQANDVQPAVEEEKPEADSAVTPEASAEFAPGQNKKGRRTAIPAAVKRAVDLRDGEQCTENFPDGRRCPERAMLEYDHDDLICRGGVHDAQRIHKKCRAHNQARARAELGDYYMDRWKTAASFNAASL